MHCLIVGSQNEISQSNVEFFHSNSDNNGDKNIFIDCISQNARMVSYAREYEKNNANRYDPLYVPSRLRRVGDGRREHNLLYHK